MSAVANSTAATSILLLLEAAAPVGSDLAVASPFVSDSPHISSNGHSMENWGVGKVHLNININMNKKLLERHATSKY